MTLSNVDQPEYPNQEYSGLVISPAAVAKQRTRNGQMRYFFLDGQLHKRISVNRGKDLITTFHFGDGVYKKYNYTVVLQRHNRAFTTNEVAAMIGRSRRSIQQAVKNGHISIPQHAYNPAGPRQKKTFWFWQEDEIMDMLDYFAGVHTGRPRKDGAVTPAHLPTPRELRAMIRNENLLYVKRGDQMVPTWRAPIL